MSAGVGLSSSRGHESSNESQIKEKRTTPPPFQAFGKAEPVVAVERDPTFTFDPLTSSKSQLGLYKRESSPFLAIGFTPPAPLGSFSQLYDSDLSRETSTPSSSAASKGTPSLTIDICLNSGREHMSEAPGEAGQVRQGESDSTNLSRPTPSERPPNRSSRPTPSSSNNQSRRPPAHPRQQSYPSQPVYSPQSTSSPQDPPPTTSPPFPPISYPPHLVQYQHGAYMSGYTMSPPLSMAPAPHFAYSHAFTHSGIHAPDNSLGQPMIGMPGTAPFPPGTLGVGLQPRGPPLYPFQRSSSEASLSTSTHSFNQPSNSPGLSGQSGYPAPPTDTNIPSAQPPGQHIGGPSHSASFPHPSASYASPMHYASTSATTHYAYPAQSFPHSSPAAFPSIYAPSPYPQPFLPHQSSSEEPKGTWWYLPPGAPSPVQQFEPYQGHYAMGFAPVQGMDGTFPGTAAPPTSSSPTFPISPVQASMRFTPLSAPPQYSPTHTLPSLQPTSPQVPTSSEGREVLSGAPSAENPPSSSRRPYHPNPPAHRSEWVMWVGNVPADATHDELWRFFNQPAAQGAATQASRPAPPQTAAGLRQPSPEQDVWGGVSSVFLISRSNCAFINFDTEAHLERAVSHFNGLPIRPQDPRCPRLVCRVRRKDDDLKAGVGGQRGMGMHTRWVKEQKEKAAAAVASAAKEGQGFPTEPPAEDPPTSPSTHLTPSSSSDPSLPLAALSSPSDDGQRPPRPVPAPQSSGASYASTNSSFLAKHFPKRYFILKSLTQFDLNLSVERGVWATQPHNEVTLDQAYRTSKEVFLIFGANKSGEFFGYAKMIGPISKGERRVSWASRDSVSTRNSPVATRGSQPPEAIAEETQGEEAPSSSHVGIKSHMIFSPTEHRLADASPSPVTPGEQERLESVTSSSTSLAPRRRDSTQPQREQRPQLRGLVSAPTELSDPHKRFTFEPGPVGAGTDPQQLRGLATKLDPSKALSADASSSFELDASAPMRAKRDESGATLQSRPADTDNQARPAEDAPAEPSATVVAEKSNKGEEPKGDGDDSWGTPFKIQWIRTERLPFHRTRHLRNPWNHDREVKVSRDGTEIEPTVGQQLLDEWDRPDPAPTLPNFPASSRRGARPPLRGGLTQPATPTRPSRGAPATIGGDTARNNDGWIGGGGSRGQP